MAYNPNNPTTSQNTPTRRDNNRDGQEWSNSRLDPGGDWAASQYSNLTSNSHRYSKSEYQDLFPDTTDSDYARYNELFDIIGHNKLINSQQQSTDNYWANMKDYMQSQPGYEAYSDFIPKYLQRVDRLQQGQLTPFTGPLTVDQDPRQAQMMDYLGGQLNGGIDQTYDRLGGLFKSVKGEFLPAMDANFTEQVVNPMQEKLNRMGLSGSTPGMEMSSGAAQSYAIQRAKAGASMDQQYAGQMLGLEQARQGAWGQDAGMMQSLMGQDEARQRQNIGTQYQDYLTQQNDQFQRLGLAGNAMSASAGALSSAAGQGIQAASIPYEQANAWDMRTADNAFMAPYYDAMSENNGGGGGGKGGK